MGFISFHLLDEADTFLFFLERPNHDEQVFSDTANLFRYFNSIVNFMQSSFFGLSCDTLIFMETASI